MKLVINHLSLRFEMNERTKNDNHLINLRYTFQLFMNKKIYFYWLSL